MALDVAVSHPLRLPSWLPFIGPAVAVSIGYVDPGNWASDLAAGTFGCTLLWVVVLSNVIAIVVQIAVTRVTLAYGSDLGTLINGRWPRARHAFWATFQCAAIATDVAEFAGIVLGTQLLFALSAPIATGIGLLIIFGLLTLLARKSMRVLDFIFGLVLLAVGVIFVKLAITSHIPAAEILRGAIVPSVPGAAAIFIIVAVIGATVMPHNLFLHSTLVAKRVKHETASTQRSLRNIFAIETQVTLTLAMLVNIAIVIVGVSLHGRGATIQSAFGALRYLGAHDGSFLFGTGLLASAFAATLTSTLAGDYIYRSFGGVKVSAFTRRAVTVVPAALVLGCGADATSLLLFSQVALCLTLPIVLIPLVLLLRSCEGASTGRGRRFVHFTTAAAATCVAVDLVFLITSII